MHIAAERPAMTFDESVLIDTGAAGLFHLSQDYGQRLEWDPFLRSARLVSPACEPGSERALFVARSGWSMETEYVSFNPPHAVAVKMTP
jgi:hypothetical protein